MKINKLLIIIGWILVSISTQAFAQEEKITNEKIYRELKVFQAQTEERFKAMEQRFEQMDKRFEQMDKHFEKGFEQIDKRFEQIDKRFEQLNHFLTIIASIITALVIAVIGFAYWDRRSIIRKAREDTIEYIEQNNIPNRLYDVLRELAKEEPKVAKVLKRFHLL